MPACQPSQTLHRASRGKMNRRHPDTPALSMFSCLWHKMRGHAQLQREPFRTTFKWIDLLRMDNYHPRVAVCALASWWCRPATRCHVVAWTCGERACVVAARGST